MKEFLFKIGLLNPLEGWLVAIIATILVCFLIVLASLRTSSFWLRKGQYSKKTLNLFFLNLFLLYPLHAFIQQFITFFLWGIFNLYFPGWPWTNILTAFVFAALHFPNLFLMFPAGCLMFFALDHMEIYHNIFPLALMHGMVATCWERLTPKWIITTTDSWITNFGKYPSDQRKLNKKYNLLKKDYTRFI